MKILIIAYYYPPAITGGSLRPKRWVDYLTSLKHEVAVLTHTYVKTSFSPNLFPVYDPSHNLNRKGIYKIKWLFLRLVSEFFNRSGRYHSIYSWWIKNVTKYIPALKKTFSPDLIIATYSPVECLELGIKLSAAWKIPLVADFRDGLLFEPIESRRICAFKSVQRYYRRIEEETLKYAQGIISAHPNLDLYFQKKYPVKNTLCLTNGFDPADFKNLPRVNLPAGKLNIVHAGNFTLSDAGCKVEPFFLALKSLMKNFPLAAGKILFHQLGEFSKKEYQSAKSLIDSGVLIYHGKVPRPVCLAYQKNADILFLITSLKRPGITPGKIFEYLYVNKPILALGRETYSSEIIRQTKSGWVLDSNNTAKITGLLQKFITESRSYRQFSPDPGVVRQYNIKTQIKTLDKFLEKIKNHFPYQ